MGSVDIYGANDGGMERDLNDAGIRVKSVHYTASGDAVVIMERETLDRLIGFRERAERTLASWSEQADELADEILGELRP